MLPKISRFVLPPAILIAGLVAYRLIGVQPPANDLLPKKNVPWVVRPKLSEPRIATNDQLREVLEKMLPTAEPVHTNNYIHALRLWGAEAKFSDPKLLSGMQMRDYFLNDQTYQALAGKDAPPLFVKDKEGVRARDFDDNFAQRDTSSHHNDDLLATFAEIGVPLDTPLVMRDGETTVGQFLTDSMRRFHPARHEFEWSVISYLRYLYPLKEWRNNYGDKIDVAKMTQMCTGKFGLGPCRGMHRFEALVVMLNVDDEAKALAPQSRKALLGYLKAASDKLTVAQATDGSWTARWVEGAAAQSVAEKKTSVGKEEGKEPVATRHEKLLVTGHMLEWLALAPEEVHPPRETIVRAGQWLCNTMNEMDRKEIMVAYGPYTHAARALCLWRGKEAFPMWQELNPEEKLSGELPPRKTAPTRLSQAER